MLVIYCAYYSLYRDIYLLLLQRKPLPFFHYSSLINLCGELKLYDVGATF